LNASYFTRRRHITRPCGEVWIRTNEGLCCK